MKKLILIIAAVCFFTQLFSQVVEMTIVEKCSLSGSVTIPDNEIWECNGTVSIAAGTVINGTGIFIAKNKVTLSGSLEIKEGSFVRFDGGLILATGANLTNKGSLCVEGDVTMQGTAKFYNHGTTLINNGSFTGVTGITFSNETGGVLKVINPVSNTTKTVTFGALGKSTTNALKIGMGTAGLFFKAGSSFETLYTDINIFVDAPSGGTVGAIIDGSITVIDANISFDCDNNNSRILFSATSFIGALDKTAPYDDKGRISFSLLSNWLTVDIEGSLYATDFYGRTGGGQSKVNYCSGSVTLWFDYTLNLKYAFDAACKASIIVGSKLGMSYEDFLKGADGLLPIELTRFIATATTDNTVLITWETGSETNNDYFSLYRSFNGIDFTEIATIAGAGTSSKVQNYDFYDHTTGSSSIVYYKLKQTDYNGATTISNIIWVYTETAGQNFEIIKLQNHNGTVSMELQFSSNEQQIINIYSLKNILVHSQTITNTLSETVYIQNLSKGIYVVECVSNNKKQSKKIKL
ncbi:MAG: T9SS type A sorting domain-containing protein [Bacteroidetes bacterium]|nr:T9SS type A sorting domain-containing protein [Bacteroidota bacterium]